MWNLYRPDSQEVRAYAQIISQNINDTSMDPALVNSRSQVRTKAKPSSAAIASLVLSTVALASLIVLMSGWMTAKVCSKSKRKDVDLGGYSLANKQNC